ncbi:MAG: RagB/SusD family nutrient uptake outer membrane protein [Aestuariibaculum sp.]
MALLFLTLGCSDDILEKYPLDSLVEETTFTSNRNFETFAWGFYEVFDGYNLSALNYEFRGDLICRGSGSQTDPWLRQNVSIPAADSDWNSAYRRIRRVNIMLRNTDNGVLDELQKSHWEGVGRFFRAINYYGLLNKFGGVPWLGDEVLTDESEALYAPRASRDELAQHILDDLLFAESHVQSSSNNNTIDKSVVRALISRFGLFEGTWRKYHGLDNENQYLQASFDASTKLIADHPSLIEKYDLVFNSASLAGEPGILLYKDYIFGELTHIQTSRHRNSAGNWDLTKKAVDKYLFTDGTPFHTNPNWETLEQDPYDEFRDRDRRLYIATVPPFRVVTSKNQDLEFTYHTNPKFREYLDFMATYSDAAHKGTPTQNWAGFIVKQEPHFRRFNQGQGFNVTYTGYRIHKFYNNLNTGIQNQDFADAPIFRMGEVLVNHAEAAYELGLFTQDIANVTINKLRDRGEVAALDIANIVADPTKDDNVDTILWEIRRERAVELMAEGFRPDDLRRWKKFVEYGGQEKLGRWVVNSDYNNRLPIQGGAAEGYVSPFGVPPGVPEHYYLAPIPSGQIVLNPNIDPNPGWE